MQKHNQPAVPAGELHTLENGVQITVTRPEDPAYALLQDDFTTTPVPGLFRADCYICRDPEFQLMGLPLCSPCRVCGGHVPADDTVCTDCGGDQCAN